MARSDTVLAAAARYPKLASPVVRGACTLSIFAGRNPHWLLMRLKDVLGVRLAYKMQVEGFTIEADPLDGPGRRFRTEGLTEPETRAVFSELLRPGMTVLDIGAYVGQFSLVASRAWMASDGSSASSQPRLFLPSSSAIWPRTIARSLEPFTPRFPMRKGAQRSMSASDRTIRARSTILPGTSQ